MVRTPAYEAQGIRFESQSRLFFPFQDPFLSYKFYFIHVTAGQIATAFNITSK